MRLSLRYKFQSRHSLTKDVQEHSHKILYIRSESKVAPITVLAVQRVLEIVVQLWVSRFPEQAAAAQRCVRNLTPSTILYEFLKSILLEQKTTAYCPQHHPLYLLLIPTDIASHHGGSLRVFGLLGPLLVPAEGALAFFLAPLAPDFLLTWSFFHEGLTKLRQDHDGRAVS
jgi:hypothetical protein